MGRMRARKSSSGRRKAFRSIDACRIRASDEHMSVNHALLPSWLGTSQPDQTALAPIKQALAERGVNARAWRLYLDYGDALFTPLDEVWIDPASPDASVTNAVSYLKLLQACEMDVPPPLALAKSLPVWEIPDMDLSRVPPLLLRAAWKATAAAEYTGDDLTQFVDRKIVPVARWFFHSGACQTTDGNLLKAGWDSLAKRREAWVVEQRRLDQREWAMPVRWLEWDAYRFVGLTSKAALAEEGEAMYHCVGDYGDDCRTRPLRIYSVRYRASGRRVATLSVAMDRAGAWDIDQLKGVRNGEVEARVWHAVAALLDTLRQTCRTHPVEWLARMCEKASDYVLDDLASDLPF